MERVSGIEPPSSAWKAEVLPLNYTRLTKGGPQLPWWRGEDSNLRRLSQQIYSLPPLTAREPLQKRVIVLQLNKSVNHDSQKPFLLRTPLDYFVPECPLRASYQPNVLKSQW